MHGIPQHLQSLGVKGVSRALQENRGRSELGEERDQRRLEKQVGGPRRSLVLAQEVQPSPPTHLHKHPLNLNITLRKLILFQRKDKEQVEALEEQGWEPRLSDSAQRLLQGKFRRDQGCRAQLPTQTGEAIQLASFSPELGEATSSLWATHSQLGMETILGPVGQL